MKENDKIIAVGGIALIFILAIIALVLLVKKENVEPAISVQTERVNDNNVKLEENKDTLLPADKNKNNGNDNVRDASEITGEQKSDNVNFKYEPAILKEIRKDDNQMEELFSYWDQYHMEAIADLIRLARVKELTNSLSGTSYYYYYGNTNDANKPEGKGLAIYADNTYYFGEWKNGLREGNGMWLQIFPDKEGVVGSNYGVTEHQYNGEWKNDLPNGNGQEHYSYNTKKLKGELSMANAIGGFKNGYYNGDLYIMTLDEYGVSYGWYATANAGVFDMIEDKVSTTNKHPYWRKGNDNDHSTDEYDDGYYWFLKEENKNWGIYGLMK